MGVLEDAIREHLELKRQHGASDEEVEREESEALGPPHRDAPVEGEEPQEAPADQTVAPADDAPAELELSETGPSDALSETGPSDAAGSASRTAPADFATDFHSEPKPDEFGAGARPEPSIGEAPEDFVEQADPEPEPEPELEPEPVAFDEEEPGVAPPMPAQPESEQEPRPEAPKGDAEDMLEDTPDFLQDTPEHDRLWFEQKPPRDFDFD
jgi:hypothetical protein